MFDLAPGWEWILIAYVVGTAFGLFTQNFRGQWIVEKTIDNLIENGYLKHRKDANGEIEILKYNSEEN